MIKNKIIPYVLIFAASLTVGAIFSEYSDDKCEYEDFIAEDSEELTLVKAEIPPSVEPGPININTASAAELMSLEGIGAKMSKKIIDYREKNGNFEKIEDIMKIPGIGTKKFQKIKEHIVVQ